MIFVKTKFGQRILSFMLSVLTVAALTVIAVPRADAAPSDSTGGAAPSKYYDSGTVIAGVDDWTAANGTSSSAVSHSGDKALRLYSKSGTGEIDAIFTDGISVGGYKEAGVYVTSISSGICTVEMTVLCDSGVASASAEIPTGEEYYIFTPLPDNAERINGISVTASVTSDESTAVSAIIRSAVLSVTDHADNISRYSAFAVSGLGDGGIVSADTPVRAAPVTVPDSGDSFALCIKLSGSGGGIALHYTDDGEEYGVYGSTVITEGKHSYIFPVESITSESAYRIVFSGIDDSDVRLDGVSLIPYVSAQKYDNLGVISKCAYSEGTISVSGSITRDAAVKHIDGDVCLYEFPMWSDPEDILTGDPVDSIKMSTSFSFSLPITEDYSVFTAYTVALRDKSGVYPLTDPIYPTHTSTTDGRSPAVSVSGISPEDVFTLGADNYIIDVGINSIFIDKGTTNSSVFTYDGYSYYPSEDFVSEISRNVQFLSSAGIGTLFRVSAEDISHQSADDCRTLAAVVSYLSDNFSPYGFIMDFGNGTTSSDAYSTASFVRLISTVSGEDSVIYVPITVSDDTESFMWLLTEYISNYPKLNWEPIFSDTSENSDVLLSYVSDIGYSSKYTVSCELVGNNITSSDIPLGNAGNSYIIDITDGILPDMTDGTQNRYETYTEWNGGTDDTVTLWDFTSSYDSGGFTVPSGPIGIFTGTDDTLEAFTGISACRALKTTLGGGSNVIVARPASSMDLSAHPVIRFLMAGKTDSPFSVDIIFISGKERAVFTASFDQSGVYAPVCDLSLTDIAGKIDRIAIVLRDGGPVELSIASVSATGSGGASNIRDIYITDMTETDIAPAPSDTSDGIPTGIMAIGALTVITLVIFVVLSRKKPEK